MTAGACWTAGSICDPVFGCFVSARLASWALLEAVAWFEWPVGVLEEEADTDQGPVGCRHRLQSA